MDARTLTRWQAVVQNLGQQRMTEPARVGRTHRQYTALLGLGDAAGQPSGLDAVT